MTTSAKAPLEHRTPRVGVGIIVRYRHKLLIGRRLKPPMPGSWQLPGGWVLFGETPEQAVTRHLSAFKGAEFSRYVFQTYTNNLFDKDMHSLTLYFMTECMNGDEIDLQVNSRCGDWHWADWESLPQPLFLPLELLQQTSFHP